MTDLVGTPSDDVPAILATGGSGVASMFVSLARRHPEGDDAGYLAWHSLDHRPEQYRLGVVRSSLRLVSTPECRAARAAARGPFDEVDHVMTYFFAEEPAETRFQELSDALGAAGRKPFILPPVHRSSFHVRETVASPAMKVGADVLPWWPATGGYVLLEPTACSAAELVRVDGVAGVWSGVDGGGQQCSLAFLDADPVVVGERLRPVLEERWAREELTPLLAAPFHAVVPREWDRYLP